MAKVGRPPAFKNAEELQDKIDEYISRNVSTPTITGLAYHLGFSDRRSFYDYENKPEFTYTVKRARLYIEQCYEQALHDKNVTGAIFALKNFGWKDKTETEHSGQVQVSATKLTDTQLDKLTQGKIDE